MAILQRESLTRRNFVKLAAAAGAIGLVAGVADNSALAADDKSTGAADEIKRIRTCCRACGKMECGVFVTVKNGRAIKVEGDESNYHSEGHCCIKSQSSMQCAYHPDRLRYPMKRTNPKGSEDAGWVRISWDEAFEMFDKGTHDVCDKYGYETYCPKMGTSRFQALVTGSFSPGGNSPKIGAAQVCKGPRRFVGHLCLENGAYFNATIDRPLVYLQWGTDQTQSNYDDSCRVVNEAAQRAKIFISVDPRVSNCGKEADYHLALKPGTDGAMAMAWCNIVIRDELYDDLLLRRWSNAPFLICEEVERTGWDGVKFNQSKNFPVRTRLLKESDIKEDGDPHKFMVWDELHDKLVWFNADENNTENGGMWEGQTEHNIPTTGWEYERGGWVPDPQPFPVDIYPALWSGDGFPVTLKDGTQVKCKTVWQKWYDEDVKDMTPAKAAEICDVDEQLIEDACHAWAERIDPRRGNGGCNFQLAPEQTGNCTMNFRALYMLFFMTGNYDVPAGNRGMTRCAISWSTVRPGSATYPKDATGINGKTNMEKTAHQPGVKEFPMLGWHNGIKDANYIYMAMTDGTPYPVRAMHTAGAGLQQQCDTSYVYDAVKSLDWYSTCDLWHTPESELADVLMPARHWMEVEAWVRSAQGANGALGCVQKCIETVGESKSEYWIAANIAKTWGQPWFADGEVDHPDSDIMDFNVKKEGWKNWQELLDYFNENSWINVKETNTKTWGTYRRYEMGYMRQGSGNQSDGKNDWIPGMPTPTMKMELWSTIAESVMPDGDPILPTYEPSPLSYENHPEYKETYPFILTTGARAIPFFHNEHRQLPWCREMWPTPRIEINPNDAEKLGIKQGDWVWIESTTGKKIRQTADLSWGMKPGIANANHQWWYPELPEASHGWNLSDVNYLVDRWAQDRYVGSSQLRAYPVKLYKATAENSPFNNPVPCGIDGTEVITTANDPRLKAWAEKIERIAANPSEWEVIGDREVK